MKEFESLLETVAGLAAANIVMVETLHEHGILDKRHFAHAFGRALHMGDPPLGVFAEDGHVAVAAVKGDRIEPPRLARMADLAGDPFGH